jgi:hypothetical protein
MFFYMVLDLELNVQERGPFGAKMPEMASITCLS